MEVYVWTISILGGLLAVALWKMLHWYLVSEDWRKKALDMAEAVKGLNDALEHWTGEFKDLKEQTAKDAKDNKALRDDLQTDLQSALSTLGSSQKLHIFYRMRSEEYAKRLRASYTKQRWRREQLKARSLIYQRVDVFLSHRQDVLKAVGLWLGDKGARRLLLDMRKEGYTW